MSDYYPINKLIFMKPHLPGLGENIELPNYFLKPHTVCATFGSLPDDYSVCRSRPVEAADKSALATSKC